MTSTSKSPTSSARSFIASLVLLIVALIVFVVVMVPKKHGDVAPMVKRDDAAASLDSGRRRHLRDANSYESTPRSGDAVDAHAAGKLPAAGELHSPVSDPEVQKAIDLIDKGNVSEAVTALEGIVKRDPKNENALVELAMINLLDLKQPDQAINYLQRVAEVNPRNQVVMSELVSLYEEENRLDDGLAFLQEVHNKDPQNTPDIAYGIGEIMTMTGRDADAVPFLERATQSPENGVRAYRELAEAYARNGDTEQALDSYTKAIAAQEKDIQDKQAKGLPTTFALERQNYTKLDMAREYVAKGEPEKAQQLLDEVAPAMPNNEGVTALQESINKKRAG